MGRRAQRPHELTLRNRQGQAVCKYRNVEYRFGRWDAATDTPSPEAMAAFRRQVGRWALDPHATAAADPSPLLSELWGAWLASPQSPRMAPHLLDLFEAVLFGSVAAPGPHLVTPVSAFTAVDLMAWQTHLCTLTNDRGEMRFGRDTVTKFVGLVRRAFEWGVTAGRCSFEQAAALKLVKPPARGQVKEPVPRRSVAIDAVEAAAARIASPVADLLRVMWWTGARPGELCGLTVGMVATGGVIRSQVKVDVSVDLDGFGVWAANLGDKHKTAHKGKERVIFFGPRAQGILQPHLAKGRDRPLFESGNGLAYTSKQVREYAGKACDRAGIGRWTPYQLDHSFLSRVMTEFSTDAPGTGQLAAAAARGHTLRGVTQVYTGTDWVTAARVAQRCG